MQRRRSKRFEVGPTLQGCWQVLDLERGVAACVAGLTADRMSLGEARDLADLLNEIDADETASKQAA